MSKLKITERAVWDLVPYENNPRNNATAIAYVAESIRSFGFLVPIVVDESDVIVAGHTRLAAALELGLEKVPCVVAEDLTPEQVKAFRLADNKVTEMSFWDYEALRLELDALSLDMEAFGFDSESALADFDIAVKSLGEAAERDNFAVTLVFPLAHQKAVTEYIKEHSKEPLVDAVLAEVKSAY